VRKASGQIDDALAHDDAIAGAAAGRECCDFQCYRPELASLDAMAWLAQNMRKFAPLVNAGRANRRKSCRM
jgi:hypothetical protein